MAIEIKQMVVKTTVGSAASSGGGATTGCASDDLEAIKDQILAECRDLFYELLNEEKER
jgi:hypothetical protein